MASDKPNWLSRVFGLGEDKQQPAEAAQSAGDRELGPALPDDFVVERVLGEGGMGKVYLVTSQTTPMRFAVKRAKGMKEAERHFLLCELSWSG